VFHAQDSCSYAKRQIDPQVMFAVNSLGQAGKWNKEGKVGKSLEIIATYNSSLIMYS